MNQRIQKLQAWMKENGIEVSFITSSENVFYLSGFSQIHMSDYLD